MGRGTAGSTAALLGAMRAAGVPMESLAVHFHDTFGQALANILVALGEVYMNVANRNIVQFMNALSYAFLLVQKTSEVSNKLRELNAKSP